MDRPSQEPWLSRANPLEAVEDQRKFLLGNVRALVANGAQDQRGRLSLATVITLPGGAAGTVRMRVN